MRCDGGWEKALGWGLKVGDVDGRPRAVAFSSSSSSSSLSAGMPGRIAVCWRGMLMAGETCSVELPSVWSSSLLSVSSYSSWLLVPACAAAWLTMYVDGMWFWCICCSRLRLGGYELLPTRRPVVTISSPMDDREDDDG